VIESTIQFIYREGAEGIIDLSEGLHSESKPASGVYFIEIRTGSVSLKRIIIIN